MSILRLIRRFRQARKAQVIGICRFSYPALGGFQIVHDSPDQRADFLYAKDRLDERFRLFEAFTLPSLRAQTDQNFTFLIVIGDDFPPDRLAQLTALTKDMPQVVIKAYPPGRHRTVMADAINSVRLPDRLSIQFRHDDDDAVAVQFVARLRRTVRQCYPLLLTSHVMAIDYTCGFNASGGPDGIAMQEVRRLFLGVAFAVVARPDTNLTVMNFTHFDIWKHMPTITRNDPNMWVRGANDFNDSGESLNQDLAPLTPEQEGLFQRRFGITADRVRAIWRR